MPEDKSLGSKILGLFVETRDDGTPTTEETPALEGAEKSAAQLVAELASQSAPKKGALPAESPAPRLAGPTAPRPLPSVPVSAGPVIPATVDFDAVFKNAGLDPGELDRVRKAEELLKGLPEGTPKEIKRQIVEASLRAFGFDVQKIGQAAQNQLKAVETWVRVTEQQTAKAIADAQGQIAQLEDKVISLRADITKRSEQLASMAAAADLRRSQVGRVLEFFQLEPSAPGPSKT